MKKEYTQQDLVVLYLAGRDGWTFSYELNGRQFGKYFLGSQSDKRMIENFGGCVTDQEEKTAHREIDGAEYTIITKKLDGRRVYKAWLSKAKPQKPHYEIKNINGEPVALLIN